MDATRADLDFTAEVVADRHRRGRHDDQHPRHRRLRDAAGVRGLPDAPVRARARPARRRALGPLPRRPRAGRGQLVRRRAGRRAPGRVRDQRHRRARGQRVARGDRDAAAHAPGRRRAEHGRRHARDRAHEPPGQPPHRLPGAAQQGDRRAQRLRPRVGHPPGRHPQGALDLRDHGRHHGRPGRQPARARQALRPPRAALGARGARLPGRRPGAEHRLQALQGARGQEEAGHRDGPRGARHRRAARGGRRLHAASGSTSRPPRAARRTRRSACARPTATVVQGSFTGDGPIDAVFRAINAATGLDARLREFRVDAVTGGQDALGEVVGRRRAGRNAGERVGLPGVLLRERATGAGQAVTTDIIEAAGMAYARALTNAVRAACTSQAGRRRPSRRPSSPRP